MAKVKGIVAKVSGKNCILITSQGEFVKARTAGSTVSVGQEIEAQRLVPLAWRKMALAVAALLLLSVIIPFYPVLTASAAPAAYVSLDINPSLELGINKQGIVIETKAFNQAGSKLLNTAQVKQTDVYQALKQLLNLAVQEGFITKTQNNLLVVSYTGDGHYTLNQQQLTTIINGQITAADLQAQVVLTPTTMAIHRQAQADHMSQGKYLVMQAAKAKGVTLDPNQLTKGGITQALQAKGIEMSELEHMEEMGVAPQQQGQPPATKPGSSNKEKMQIPSPGQAKDRTEKSMDKTDRGDKTDHTGNNSNSESHGSNKNHNRFQTDSQSDSQSGSSVMSSVDTAENFGMYHQEAEQKDH